MCLKFKVTGAAARLVCVAAMLVTQSGCQSLQGIPQGLTKTDRAGLSSSTLKDQLIAADKLFDVYLVARNQNLKFAFWSNIALIPLGVGAAAAVGFKASKKTIAGFGLGAGSLLATSSFINPRPNAKAYQAGLDALTCEYVNLSPYAVDALEAPEATGLQQAIDESSGLDDLTGVEVSKDVQALNKYSQALAALTLAQADAEKTVQSQASTDRLVQLLPAFASTTTRSIDQGVSAKISQSDIDYAKLTTSFTGLPAVKTAAPAAAAKPAAAAGAAAGAAPGLVSAVVAAETLNDRTKTITNATTKIRARTTDLNDRITKFGLSDAESRVSECVKSLK